MLSLPTLPVSMARLATEMTLSVPVVCWVIPMLNTKLALSASPMAKAAASRSRPGTPVISSTLSGVYLSTVSLNSWKPSQRSSMNSVSWRPSRRMTFMRPLSSATSVPPLCLSHMSAWSTSPILLGSATMSVAPWSTTACLMYFAMTGWFSVVLLPVTNIRSLPVSSRMLFVMAPDPKAFTSPATVGAWQSLAQWSTLLLPRHALTSFWKR